MDHIPCPKCGRPVDSTTRRCAFDGFEVDSSHALAVARTIERSEEMATPPKNDGPDLVGRRVGKYRIDRLVGRGGMASVWRAVHEELGGVVAIKVLDTQVFGTEDAQVRFLREARVSAQLAHEHVVKVIDFARDPQDGSYIVMEMLSGRPLDRLLAEEGPLPETRAIAIGMQIASALGAAHEIGIVHRDVKPANVFVTRALGGDFVKVVDFGIAKVSLDRGTKITRSGTMFGTPLYMSPEQWDDAEIGPTSDVYSLGVVLYETMTGHLPLKGNAMTEMAKHVALTEPRRMRERRPELSLAVDAVVLACLRKDPRERFATMAHVEHALRNASHAVAPSAPSSRRPALLAFAGITAAALAGAGVYAITHLGAKGAAYTLPPTAPEPTAIATIIDAPPRPTLTASTPAAAAPEPSATPTTTPAKAVFSPRRPSPPATRDAGGTPRPARDPNDEDDLLRKN